MLEARFLKKEDILQSSALWKERFGDSEPFLDWYYTSRFSYEHSVGVFENGILLSQAHGRIFPMYIRGQSYRAFMIGGVSTKTEAERRGYMHTVMRFLEQHAEEIGCTLLFLAAERTSDYLSCGFEVCGSVLYASGTGSGSSDYVRDVDPKTCREMAALSNTVGKHYSFFPERTQETMYSRAQELFSDGAVLYLLYHDHQFKGYAFYNEETGQSEETLAIDTDAYRSLLGFLPTTAEAFLPPDLPFPGKKRALFMYKSLVPSIVFSGSTPSFCPETF